MGYLRKSDDNLVDRFGEVNPGDIALCSVVLGELLYGAYKSHPAKQTHNLALISQLTRIFVSLPFDDKAAEEYGRLRAHLSGIGTPIGPNDSLIASIALANEMTVVTHNIREFGRVPGVVVEDWQET